VEFKDFRLPGVVIDTDDGTPKTLWNPALGYPISDTFPKLFLIEKKILQWNFFGDDFLVGG